MRMVHCRVVNSKSKLTYFVERKFLLESWNRNFENVRGLQRFDDTMHQRLVYSYSYVCLTRTYDLCAKRATCESMTGDVTREQVAIIALLCICLLNNRYLTQLHT